MRSLWLAFHPADGLRWLTPVYFTAPTISEADWVSAFLTELIAITAWLTLFHA